VEKDVGSHGILMGIGDFYEMFMGFSGDLYRIYCHFMVISWWFSGTSCWIDLGSAGVRFSNSLYQARPCK
jgi:hypothetical protein